MRKQITAFLLCTCLFFIALVGCSDSKNSALVGDWTPSSVSLNGKTMQYKDLGLDDGQFIFSFKSDGKCTATLAGITGEGTYTFNDTSVDVEINGDTQKLDYTDGSLTLTLDYSGITSSFTFVKVQ